MAVNSQKMQIKGVQRLLSICLNTQQENSDC